MQVQFDKNEDKNKRKKLFSSVLEKQDSLCDFFPQCFGEVSHLCQLSHGDAFTENMKTCYH